MNLVVMDLVYLCIMPVSLIYESADLGQVNLSGKHCQRSFTVTTSVTNKTLNSMSVSNSLMV